MFEFKVKVNSRVKYRGDDWTVIGRSVGSLWWIQRLENGQMVTVEAQRKELSEAGVK